MTIALIDGVPEKRICPICKEWKDVSTEFHKGAWYCKPCANAKTRKYHKDNKDNETYYRSKRQGWIKRVHGITLQQYEEKLVAQDYKCAICGLELPKDGPQTHLDHCHKTGILRAFLCTNCNRGLGHFQEDVKILEAAIKYLNTWKGGNR